MITLIFLLIGLGLSVIGFYRDRKYGEGAFCLGAGLLIVTIAFLFLAAGLPIRYYSTKAEITKFNATKQTLEMARLSESINELELAAIQQKAIEANQWLAKTQYWAGCWTVSWYYPKEVLRLKPIK